MAQEYTIKSWQAWENDDGPIRDKYGNYKGTATFDEYSNEPVDATFKDQPQVGDKKYGTVEPYTTTLGKERTKFKSEQRPPGGTPGGSQQQQKSGGESSRDLSMYTSYAKDLAIAVMETSPAAEAFDTAKFEEAYKAVGKAGDYLLQNADMGLTVKDPFVN